MSGTLNKVILVGNVGRDPEIRPLPDGSEVASFSLATGESWKDKNTGERVEKTEWHRIVVFNEYLIGIIKTSIKKGMKLYIEGQLQTKRWTDSQGISRDGTEIVLSKFRGELLILEPKKVTEARMSENGDASIGGDLSSADMDDSIPF